MNPTTRGIVYTCLGLFMTGLFLYSLSVPDFCKSGCGTLTEPLFVLLYWLAGSWGPRGLILVAAILFLWVGIRAWRNQTAD